MELSFETLSIIILINCTSIAEPLHKKPRKNYVTKRYQVFHLNLPPQTKQNVQL